MNKNPRFILITGLLLMQTAACLPKPNPNVQIKQAVAGTVAAIPTYTPYPTIVPYPTPSPMSLAGLFCEYQFCIGHPSDIAFFDVSAQRNPASPSSYSQGLMAAFNDRLFIQILWQLAPGTSDPNFLLDLILEDGVDTRTGTMDIKLIHEMNVLYTAITTSASSVLPHGGSGAWVCGERAFAWKAYTPEENLARALFDEAINRFRCK
jgi:hypothetical protein